MAEHSKIEWTDHTFNPWWGCTRVSEACRNCYAEAYAKRVGQSVWGPKAARRELSDNNWAKPLRWDADAAAAMRRDRVFCASMADVFEGRSELNRHRVRLWTLIEQTPNLDWLLLTKRPENIATMVPWRKRWPANVWIGTTVENQTVACERLPHLCRLPAVVRFVSAEPLVGPLDLTPWSDRLDWVITGGESGVHARVSSPSWFQDLRDQCLTAGVAFFFKQWGEWTPEEQGGHRGRISEAPDGSSMRRAGKRDAGRHLDRKVWNQFPSPRLK